MRFSLLDLLCLTGLLSLFFIARQTFPLSPIIGPFFACLVCLYHRTRRPQDSVLATTILGTLVSGFVAAELALEAVFDSFRHLPLWRWGVECLPLVFVQAVFGGVLSYFTGAIFKASGRKQNYRRDEKIA